MMNDSFPILNPVVCPFLLIHRINARGFNVTVHPPDRGWHSLFDRCHVSIEHVREWENWKSFEDTNLQACLMQAVEFVYKAEEQQ